MREVHTQDYWKKIDKYEYKSYIDKVELNKYNGFSSISIGKGIQIICGLNGAGKTTLISFLKDLLGISLDRQGEIKLGEAEAKGDIYFDNEIYSCKNIEGERLSDQIECLDKVGVVEYFNILKTLDIIWNQENFDELIEQNESIDFDDKAIEEINYLVGRQYSKISLVEIEDMDEIGTFPYFLVTAEDTSYDSRKMGMGEYCLMYIYWFLAQASKDSIILIEEPESFVAIKSQRNLMNFIAKKSIENGISFVISTHSPFIIEKVSNRNIKMISRAVGRTVVSVPKEGQANLVLGSRENIKGSLLVEDEMAKMFLRILLEREDTYIFRNYDIEVAGGSSEISAILRNSTLKKMRYKIIGVYDKDQEYIDMRQNVLPYVFLPPEKDVETAIKKLIIEQDKVDEFANAINKSVDEIIETIAQITGEDNHDWLRNLASHLYIDISYLLERVYDIWKDDNVESVNNFVNNLRQKMR